MVLATYRIFGAPKQCSRGWPSRSRDKQTSELNVVTERALHRRSTALVLDVLADTDTEESEDPKPHLPHHLSREPCREHRSLVNLRRWYKTEPFKNTQSGRL
eukprot:FR742972.1.p4 GENE.FR742972.1~~FR742972.1.p4  ORF type:complete len:102 (+),score=3.52 FR742972.1:383-688(+)